MKMARGYDTRFLEELKSKNDIVDVISRYVPLEQKGKNFWGRCPFHHEKTASFCINSLDQFYHCFGCGTSGDVITFVQQIESLDFPDAVKFLAERAHIPLPESNFETDKIRENKRKKERLLSVLTDTARFYAANLKSVKAGKHQEYLRSRGYDHAAVVKFGLGASLTFHELPSYLEQKGYSLEEMKEAGVVDQKEGTKRKYDSLGGRLIVPIINQFNQVVAFGGRLLEKSDFAKYKNTRETAVFNKSNTLFNINNLKKLKNETGFSEVIIVEGYMDTISLVMAGFENVVASMGTSLTKDQARILKRYTDNVLISYDGDFAGQKAAIRGLEILKDEGLNVKVVSLPDGMDPDDVVKKLGAPAYRKCLDEAKPLIDFKLEILKRTFDVSTSEGKRRYVSKAMEVIRGSESAAEQEELLKQVRAETGISYESLKRELENASEQKAPVKAPEPAAPPVERNLAAARYVLNCLLTNLPFTRGFDLDSVGFRLPAHRAIAEFIRGERFKNELIKPSLLLDEIDEAYNVELFQILSLDLEERSTYDKERYFKDCVRTMVKARVEEEIASLTKLYEQETDLGERKALAFRLQEKLAENNRLN